MNQRDIEYALAKQVPDMARGFTINTSFGDLVIEPGWVAGIVITHLERALRCELLELVGAAPGATDRHGFSLDACAIGGEWVHGEAQLSGPDAQTISDVLVAQHAEVAGRLQSLHDQIASLRLAVSAPLSAGPLPEHQVAPGPAQPGGAPVTHTHCAAPSGPCAELAPQQPVAPAPAASLHDRSLNSPGVEE